MEGMLRDGSIFGNAAGQISGVPADLQDEVTAAGLATTQWFLARHSYAGNNIRTQENAQHALGAIDKAIVVKDKARASLGAAQNRLENTVSNLQIQAENMQAAESRISDVDVADEMTNFVQNQVLTQAAVAMLSQANSMPNMLLSLVG